MVAVDARPWVGRAVSKPDLTGPSWMALRDASFLARFLGTCCAVCPPAPELPPPAEEPGGLLWGETARALGRPGLGGSSVLSLLGRRKVRQFLSPVTGDMLSLAPTCPGTPFTDGSALSPAASRGCVRASPTQWPLWVRWASPREPAEHPPGSSLQLLPVPFLLHCGLHPPGSLQGPGGRRQRCREGTALLSLRNRKQRIVSSNSFFFVDVLVSSGLLDELT